jgi:hypothetical protein
MADLVTGATYLYDPNDAEFLSGQKIPYISSRLNFDGTAISPVSAIPHNPKPEADGTTQNIEYGSSPQITRIDGYGNGNRSLEFDDATLNSILANGYMENPTYDYGKGPINIKVVDPLNLAPGYFECKFRDYVASTSNGNSADTASWVIYRYDEKGGNVLDSVSSERAIDSDNEQIIPEWGVSVQIFQTKYLTPEGLSGNIAIKTTDMIDATIDFSDSSKIWLTGVMDNDAFFPTNWIRSGDNNDTISTPGVAEYLNGVNYKDELFVDPNQKYESVLEGMVAPHRLTGYQADYMPLAYCNEPSPLTTSPGPPRNNASISFLPSVNIVITKDKSLWTRCPVIELGRNSALSVGGAKAGARRKSYSVDKNGVAQTDTATYKTGMGWFPGYAVDLETGARLYMAFGENSFLVGENGADMIWNPTENLVSNVGTPLMGGMHPIYVFSCDQAKINGFTSSYDFPAYIPSVAENDATNELYKKLKEVESNNTTSKRQFYASLSWIAYPLLKPGQTLLSTDVTIKLRINKEYKNYICSGENAGKPMYSWSMDKVATELGSKDQLKETLGLINVVPNPYNAFSEYERNKLDNRVKITNLPERCIISIYTTNGKLIKRIEKDSPITYQDWTLTNHANIPVASGVYLIHIEVPGVGERVLKAFIAMRMVDLQDI